MFDRSTIQDVLCEHRLQLITIECPYDLLSQSEVQELFAKTLDLKIQGYLKEYPYGILPIDTTDFVGDHMILAQEWGGKLTPIMAQRSVSLERCQIHHLPFPGLQLLEGVENAESHRAALSHLVDKEVRKNGRITYDSSVTIHPKVRENLVLKQVVRDLIWVQHVHFHESVGTSLNITMAVTQFKMDQAFRVMGYQPLLHQQNELPALTFRNHFNLNAKVMVRDKQRVESMNPLFETYQELLTNKLRFEHPKKLFTAAA
jgi:hypothetical protein